MNQDLHHIRLLAGLETYPGWGRQRVLERDDAERLAEYLAADLQRLITGVDQTLLVCAATLLEPHELLRPGFPVWQAMEKAARDRTRQHGFSPSLLSVGAHEARMPDPALQPPTQPIQGQFVAVPISLVCLPEHSAALKQQLEGELFERAGLNPPARALLSEKIGLDSIHAHLLTLADLIAIQHVQLDGAGLGGFWPLVEEALTAGAKAEAFELPAGLTASWSPRDQQMELPFHSPDSFDGTTEDYVLWLRAFRVATALLDHHGMRWKALPDPALSHHREWQSLVEEAGTASLPDGVTLHMDAQMGLVALTLVEAGRMQHVFPLHPQAAEKVMAAAEARGLPRQGEGKEGIHVHPQSGRLWAASADS